MIFFTIYIGYFSYSYSKPKQRISQKAIEAVQAYLKNKTIENVVVPCIDSNKKIEIENKSQRKIQDEKIFPMIPVSNISSINQRLNIYNCV